MTTAEAFAIADQAKPRHRQPLDKLRTGISAGQIALGAAALAKTYDAMGGTVADMQKRLDQIRADLDHVENNPGAKRIIH
jgi:predicted  nucleic acid-binding Zn-ribbon protein